MRHEQIAEVFASMASSMLKADKAQTMEEKSTHDAAAASAAMSIGIQVVSDIKRIADALTIIANNDASLPLDDAVKAKQKLLDLIRALE